MKILATGGWVQRAVALGLVPMMSGCTVLLWTPAVQKTACEPEVAGLVRNYPARGDRSLVVRYRARGDGTDVDLVVPLTADDAPVPPFAPAGTAYIVRYPNSPQTHPTAGRVSDDQIAAILSREKRVRDDRAGLAAHFNAADWSPAAGSSIERELFGPDQSGTVCLLAFRTNDTSQIEAVSPDPIGKGKSTPIVLPEGVHLVLVPKAVDRPPGDRTRDIVVASAVTPVSLAGDVAGAGIITGIVAGAVAIAIPVAIVSAPFVLIDQKSHPPAKAEAAVAPAQTRKESTGPVTVPVYIGHAPAATAPAVVVQALGN